ncbi:MAG: hypothetical protein ACI81I_000512 [Arcobacteraceae bacterium]|jgi:hypothetical protein
MEANTTPQEVKKNNTLVYILLATMVILLVYIGYIYSSHDMLKKNDVNNKYLLQEDVTFEMLPANIKSEYIKFSDHSVQINILNNKISNISDSMQSIKPTEKIVEVEKIVYVTVEKIVEVEKVISTVIPVQVKKTVESTVNSENFDTYTCGTMEEGSVIIPSSCIKGLYKFLDENKNVKKIEVIGMVDEIDFKLINILKEIYGIEKINNLSKYSQVGLSRQRVVEASWLIKEYIGENENIAVVNYTLHSKNQKGFVVRAYK